MGGIVTVRSDSSNGYVAHIEAAGQQLVIDESDVAGAEKTGPGPYDYILSALGACTVVTLHMYATRKNWPLERAEVRLQQESVLVPDPLQPDKTTKRLLIIKELFLIGSLTPEQRRRLEDISGRCPVQKVLEAGVLVQTVFAPDPPAA